MEFLAPGSLWLLLLGIIPVLLYLVRRRSKKVRVSTLAFFRMLAQEHQEAAWMRRLKRFLSFILTLLLLILPILALARLFMNYGDIEKHRTVVILLDRSASMAAQDEAGESRLHAAKQILRTRLERLPEEVGVALIAYDQRAEVLQPRTTRRRELLAALDQITIRPVADRKDVAVEAVQMATQLAPPSVVWHFSDELLGDAIQGAELKERNMALPSASNFGITTMNLRTVPLQNGRFDLFIRIALNRDSAESVDVRLEVSVGGIPSQVREFTLKPSEENALSLRVNGSRGQLLRLSVTGKNDDLALDNDISLPLPDARPILAAWIRPDDAEDPYTRLALSSLQESGSFELLKGNPSAWPLSEKVDAVIFDHWLPETWPENLPGVVINPPTFSGTPFSVRTLSAPIPYDNVRSNREDHPVLFRVSTGRVALTQTALYETKGSLETLWTAGRDPVLSAGEIGGRRIVMMGFSPKLSERLPLTASFPILMGNALFWCVEPMREKDQPLLHHTGDLVKVSGDSISWSSRGTRDWETQKFPLTSSLIEMDHVGSWETSTGEKGGAALLSAHETNLATLNKDNAGDTAYFDVSGRSPTHFRSWILALILCVLIVESWLFHRHAVY